MFKTVLPKDFSLHGQLVSYACVSKGESPKSRRQGAELGWYAAALASLVQNCALHIAITWVSHAHHMLSLTTELYINRPCQWSIILQYTPLCSQYTLCSRSVGLSHEYNSIACIYHMTITWLSHGYHMQITCYHSPLSCTSTDPVNGPALQVYSPL